MRFQREIGDVGDIHFNLVGYVCEWRIYRSGVSNTLFVLNGGCFISLPTIYDAIRFIDVISQIPASDLWKLNISFKHSDGCGYFPCIEALPMGPRESEFFKEWRAPRGPKRSLEKEQ
jgi:hypothetical protein